MPWSERDKFGSMELNSDYTSVGLDIRLVVSTRKGVHRYALYQEDAADAMVERNIVQWLQEVQAGKIDKM